MTYHRKPEESPMKPSPFVSAVRGLEFTGLAAGPVDGPPVLLLHGFPQFADCWLPLMDGLAAAGYRAAAFDQRGYADGARPSEPSAYATEELVSDALAVGADVFHGRPFHLVGHDWGGGLAWQAAGSAPDRLRTLTLLSTPHPSAFAAALADPKSDQRERSRYIGYFRSPGQRAEQGLLKNGAAGLYGVYEDLGADRAAPAVRRLAANDGAALTGGLTWYRSASLLLDPGPVTLPTLYIWGELDPALGRDAAESTARHVEGPYRFTELSGAGHWLPELETDRVLPELLAHLA
ncbi:alpha/beta hydrolase [Streptomyces sp. NPDC047315]|uniref:alpha/beta fold hydrolase n=1 Tax=Streptomyces sp. NPDC047315 TaxID=3155142 RepID=UPI0033F5257F